MNKEEQYSSIISMVKSIIEGETDAIANMANVSSILFNNLKDLNWAGFYIFRENQLVLGPFQGKPACIRIDIGKGVCGTSAEEKKIMRIDNVHEFEGHIPCDAASNSEIVLPLVKNDKLVGVLDIDSPIYSRFDSDDSKYLEIISKMISEQCNWENLF